MVSFSLILKLVLNIKFQWIFFLGEVIDLKKLEIGLIRMLVHYYVCTSFGAVHKGRILLPNRMIFWKSALHRAIESLLLKAFFTPESWSKQKNTKRSSLQRIIKCDCGIFWQIWWKEMYPPPFVLTRCGAAWLWRPLLLFYIGGRSFGKERTQLTRIWLSNWILAFGYLGFVK